MQTEFFSSYGRAQMDMFIVFFALPTKDIRDNLYGGQVHVHRII